ncbi:hypothetical protein ACS0TY_031406 [Phlomoides rotata]
MTSCRQPKRKRVEISREQDDCMDVASVKKSACGTGQGPHKATESIRATHLEPPIQLQIPSTKIKLQLFPLDESTRLVIEKDGKNPFLELTLGARKRISSVVRHLNAKWGSSTDVMGQLMLFPYNTKLEELASCKRWTSKDSTITAREVYVDVGSPSIFRLRYGWFSHPQPEMYDVHPKSSPEAHISFESSKRGCPRVLDIPNHQYEQIHESRDANKTQISVNEALDPDVNELKASDIRTNLEDDELTTKADPGGPGFSTVLWDDNLTNLCIGGLLADISLQGKINGSNPNPVNKSGMQQIGLISDTSIGDLFSGASLMSKINNPIKLENESSLQPIFLTPSDVSIGGLFSEASLFSNKNKLDKQTMGAGHELIQSPWDDTLTTLSIGGLLSEASLSAKAGGNPGPRESKSSLESNAYFSHFFDSLISSHMHMHSQMPNPSRHEPSFSILDAEETCQAFPIRKLQSGRDSTTSNARISSIGCSNGSNPKGSQFPEVTEVKNETVSPKDSFFQELHTFSRNH